jgi:hypothetical protein
MIGAAGKVENLDVHGIAPPLVVGQKVRLAPGFKVKGTTN